MIDFGGNSQLVDMYIIECSTLQTVYALIIANKVAVIGSL